MCAVSARIGKDHSDLGWCPWPVELGEVKGMKRDYQQGPGESTGEGSGEVGDGGHRDQAGGGRYGGERDKAQGEARNTSGEFEENVKADKSGSSNNELDLPVTPETLFFPPVRVETIL